MKIATKITKETSDSLKESDVLKNIPFNESYYITFENSRISTSKFLWDGFQELSNKEFIRIVEDFIKDKTFNPQSHYDNTNGSLYLIAKQRGWDAYQFEIVKRIDRCYKKGEFKSDLEKTKSVIDIWLSECDTNLLNEKEVINGK